MQELLVSSDVRDEKFNKISETKPEDYRPGVPMTQLTLVRDNTAPASPRRSTCGRLKSRTLL